MSIEIGVANEHYSRTIALYIADVPAVKYAFESDGTIQENKITHGVSILFEPVSPGTQRDPTCSMTYEAAQRLLDELLMAGIKPSREETSGQINAMKATIAAVQAHLADMRRLVFEVEVTNKPELTGARELIDRFFREQQKEGE